MAKKRSDDDFGPVQPAAPVESVSEVAPIDAVRRISSVQAISQVEAVSPVQKAQAVQPVESVQKVLQVQAVQEAIGSELFYRRAAQRWQQGEFATPNEAIQAAVQDVIQNYYPALSEKRRQDLSLRISKIIKDSTELRPRIERLLGISLD